VNPEPGPPRKPRPPDLDWLSRLPRHDVLERKNAMPHDSCSCGFTELADESITDHLQYTFELDDNRGIDGLIHAETSEFTCSCGLTAAVAAAVDEHFLAVCTPPDRIGRDGKEHESSGNGA
jgi:hypothetical protein